MKEEIAVTIKGFSNKETAREFMKWYSGQGEQFVDEWMFYRNEKNKKISTSIMSEEIDNENLTMIVKCYGGDDD